jgi:hypothetical protein
MISNQNCLSKLNIIIIFQFKYPGQISYFQILLFNHDINLPDIYCFFIGCRYQQLGFETSLQNVWKKTLKFKVCACKHLQNFYKKHKHSHFTPFISKNDYDKPTIKNLMILYNVKVQKLKNIL